MNENISRLMDGEVDDARIRALLRGAEVAEARCSAWVCYHVIGDQLRGAHGVSRGVRRALLPRRWRPSPRCSRLARRTAPRTAQAATFAWAVAATLAAVTVVGWTAFSMVDVAAHRRRQGARGGHGARRAGQAAGDVPADYLHRAPGILAGDGHPGLAARICAPWPSPAANLALTGMRS